MRYMAICTKYQVISMKLFQYIAKFIYKNNKLLYFILLVNSYKNIIFSLIVQASNHCRLHNLC